MSISIRVSKDDIATVDVETSPSDDSGKGEKRRSGPGLRERVLDSLASKGYGALRGWMLGVLPEGSDDARKGIWSCNPAGSVSMLKVHSLPNSNSDTD